MLIFRSFVQVGLKFYSTIHDTPNEVMSSGQNITKSWKRANFPQSIFPKTQFDVNCFPVVLTCFSAQSCNGRFPFKTDLFITDHS